MSKRKYSAINYDDLHERINEMERELNMGKTKKVKKHRRRIIISSSSSSEDSSSMQSTAASRDRSLRRHVPVPDPDEPMDVPIMTDAEVPPESAQDTGSTTLKDESTASGYEILEALGIIPKISSNFGKNLQSNLAARLERICTSGLCKDDRVILVKKSLIPANCKRSAAPSLNQEIKTILTESVIQRDMAIESKQKVTAAVIACLGQAITSLVCNKNKSTEIMPLLMTAVRLMSDMQYNDSLTRRQLILSSTNKKVSESLKYTKIDSYLFGSKLSYSIKRAIANNKSSEGSKVPSMMVSIDRNVNPSTSNELKKRNSAEPHESSEGLSSKKGRTMSSKAKSRHASSS